MNLSTAGVTRGCGWSVTLFFCSKLGIISKSINYCNSVRKEPHFVCLLYRVNYRTKSWDSHSFPGTIAFPFFCAGKHNYSPFRHVASRRRMGAKIQTLKRSPQRLASISSEARQAERTNPRLNLVCPPSVRITVHHLSSRNLRTTARQVLGLHQECVVVPFHAIEDAEQRRAAHAKQSVRVCPHSKGNVWVPGHEISHLAKRPFICLSWVRKCVKMMPTKDVRCVSCLYYPHSSTSRVTFEEMCLNIWRFRILNIEVWISFCWQMEIHTIHR